MKVSLESALMIVTAAPGIAAPFGSKMTPSIDPEPVPNRVRSRKVVEATDVPDELILCFEITVAAIALDRLRLAEKADAAIMEVRRPIL